MPRERFEQQVGLQAFEVVNCIPQERMSERFVERNLDVPLAQIIEVAESSAAASRSPRSKKGKMVSKARSCKEVQLERQLERMQ